jgi:hypothetical protein
MYALTVWVAADFDIIYLLSVECKDAREADGGKIE